MKDYIKELRSFVGKRPILLCGASVIIFDEEGKVLMLHRADNHSWCFPGGAVELGEKVEEAAMREAYEETGLKVEVEDLELFGVFSGPDLHYIYPHGDEVYNVDIVYITNKFSGKVKINNESRKGSFVHIFDIPKEISPPVIPIVNELKKRMCVK
ncbi:NUDIX domain-containing protein [Paenibacillus sp. GP183]|uniref:NUDIX hydrolase n=1 Tax=Paenibacillus sp. GP183 TaxID=1882751 RepID=UPI00089AA54A|nr:NUDIX domain-containing protein [Paenibacillus sp. GP183]SED09824.1 ADP-ribose pyrophosphatase YjhB, NUDIX family [Paenibacillus sp. GP183]